MFIKKIDAFSVAYPESNDDNQTRYLTICRIETKDGVIGWGEAIPMSGTGFPEACRATEEIIKGVADLLVGRDPLNNMEIYNNLQNLPLLKNDTHDIIEYRNDVEIYIKKKKNYSFWSLIDK